MSPRGVPKQPRINVRIPKGSDLRKRLDNAIKITGIDEPTLILRCVEATIDYVEEHGEIRLPIKVVPKCNAGTDQPEQSQPPPKTVTGFKGELKHWQKFRHKYPSATASICLGLSPAMAFASRSCDFLI